MCILDLLPLSLSLSLSLSLPLADDDDDWEDIDDMEEVIGEGGGQDVADMETDTQQQVNN